MQARQYVTGSARDIDVIACASAGGQTCIQVFFVRGGHNLGNRAFFPTVPDEVDTTEALAAFLPQFYLGRSVPREILVDRLPEEGGWLAEALTEQAGHKVGIRVPQRGAPRRWLGLAEANAREALNSRLASRAGVQQQLEALGEALGLDSAPQRLECFDISHTQGERPVASCVVFDGTGPVKSDYRRFNIKEGERVIFKGKITNVADIDETGSLRRRIKSRAILEATYAETAETRRQKSQAKQERYFPEIPVESLD